MTWNSVARSKWLEQPPELWIGAIVFFLSMSVVIQPAELWLGAIAFVVLQISVRPIALSSGASGGARIVIGLLPLLALLLVARGLLRIIRDQDELYRRTRFEAIAYAAGAVIFLSFVLGTLEEMEVIEPVGSAWAGLALIFGWVVAAAVMDRRYR